jgi:hypothetical protein
MDIDELILVVTEDLKTMKTAYLALLFYLCAQVTHGQRQQAPAQLLDLQAILAAELLQRGENPSGG